MKATGKSGAKGNGKSGGGQENDGRKDRRSATGMSGSPKKGGHGGKFTWSGDHLFSHVEAGFHKEDALDVKDPNFEDPEE